MSREIKFRMWLPGINKMTYAHTLEELMNWGTKEWTNGTAVFLQYTGLKDKKGKGIYEGDIGEGDEGNLYQVTWVNSCAKYGVKVIRTEYVLTRMLTFPIQQYVNHDTLECSFDVIGNIYENPDLLPKAIGTTESAQ